MAFVIAGEQVLVFLTKPLGVATNKVFFTISSHCSKRHQCPVHHGPVGEAMFQQSHFGDPQTEYRLIYCTTAGNRRTSSDQFLLQQKRGIKLHPRLIPAPPKIKMQSSTTYVKAYPDPGHQKLRENLKPDDKYIKTDSKFYDKTSYNDDFFDRMQHAEAEPVKPPLSPETRKELTLPTIVNCSLNYETTNEKFFPKWKDTSECRLKPYGEPFIKPLFTGRFNDETVTKREFYKKSTRPRTCYIPTDVKLYGGGKFDDFTVTKDTFRLPKIVERKMPFLRNHSLKNVESMEPIRAGKIQSLTQYRRDNPPFLFQPTKRKLSRPQADKILSLSNGYNLPLITVQKTAFPNWGRREVPGLLKTEDQTEKLSGPLQKETHYTDSYKLISLPRPQVKHLEETPFVYHHNRIPFPISVNQSEYFKFRTVRPRRFHGDKAELKIYRGPPKAKFGCNTHYQDHFPGTTGERPQCFKPIDTRIVDLAKLSDYTSYNEHYPKRELPIAEICPAELVLASFC